MRIEESKVVKDILQDLAESTKGSYITTLNRFVREFVKDKTMDELVNEAKTDVKKTQQRIDDFFKWLNLSVRLHRMYYTMISYYIYRSYARALWIY